MPAETVKDRARYAAGAIVLLVALTIGLATAQTPSAPPPNDARRLVAAYPGLIDRIEGNALVWKDGTRMAIGDGRGLKDHETLLATADIKDMFFAPYVPGPMVAPPTLNADPGRARNAALFNKLYGDCTKGEVETNLVDVVWLPKKSGKILKFSRVNGAAEKLAAVSRALDALPAAFDVFLLPSAGTYVCRPIAGTTRVSAHGHGIAIDLASATTDYWRRSDTKAGAAIAYKNRVPFEIVSIFEQHGFIWGGKWYHYDTMHFEFRPEFLAQVP